MGKRLSLRVKKRCRSVVMPPALGYKAKNKGRRGHSHRLLMRPWLENLIDSKDCQIIRWVDKSHKIFSISWLHASSTGFNESEHGDLFFRWVQHTGKLKKNGYRNHSSNKTTFRCALHSLKDCVELTKNGDKKGVEAKRTYQFIEPDDPRYDSKRKARRLKKNKNQSVKELPAYKYEICESSLGTWVAEQDTTLDYLRTEGVSPALDASSYLSPASEYIEEAYVNIESLSPSTPMSVPNIPESPKLSLAADSDNKALIPNLKVLLAEIPLKNNESLTEVRPTELQLPDSYRSILEKPVAGNCVLGASNSYEVPFYHPKLITGGNVRILNINQETRSHPEFIIDHSLLGNLNRQTEVEMQMSGQQSQSATLLTFTELDNGSSVEIGSDDFKVDSTEVYDEEVLIDENEYMTENEDVYLCTSIDFIELQPLCMSNEEPENVEELGENVEEHGTDFEDLDERFEDCNEDLTVYKNLIEDDENAMFSIALRLQDNLPTNDSM